MNYMKKQVKRMSRNRMILFFVLAMYFSVFVFATMFSDVKGTPAAVPIALTGGIPAGIFLFFAVGSLISFLDYTKSKAFRRLGRLGVDSAGVVSASLNREVETAGFITKSLMLGERWICVQGAFSVRIYPCEWLVWAYTHILTVKSNLSGPGSERQNYTVMLSFRDGKQKGLGQVQPAKCDELLKMIGQKYPHALIGYNEELLALYKSDMDGFIKHVASIKGVSDHG